MFMCYFINESPFINKNYKDIFMKKNARISLMYFVSLFMTMILLEYLFFSGSPSKEIEYSQFVQDLNQGKIENVVISTDKIIGVYLPEDSVKADGLDQTSENLKLSGVPTPWRVGYRKLKDEIERQFYVVKVEDVDLVRKLDTSGINYKGTIESNWLGNFISNWVLPFAIMSLLFGAIMKKMGGKGKFDASSVLNVGGNKAKIYAADAKHLIHFDDVAGCDEAKQELTEVVDFLKNPDKYTTLGAKIPKGILLVGPPGTGKTLLAKAVAGEAGVLFYAMSGSDFVEMFVGVGAARVRDLFTQAKTKSPCIIFIDELDAIGKARSTNGMGGNDERENTLNQLLVEMNGFDDDSAVIVLAATNRPETLDKALLRPGRFDRQVQVDSPDLKGRMMILKVHAQKLKCNDDIDFKDIAAQTAGFVGADLANLCNEAALLAARGNSETVCHQHFLDAFERVIAGLEKKSTVINQDEKRVIAYHEAGHAIVGHFTKGANPVRKISIVPRGSGALGYVLQAPAEDRFIQNKTELLGNIKGLLGGRAAEQIIFNEVSTGASNDLEKVASIVDAMLTSYGMSDKAPNLSLKQAGQNNFLGNQSATKHISDSLEEALNEEALFIIETCYNETIALLNTHKEDLDKLAAILLEREILDEKDVIAILGEKVK